METSHCFHLDGASLLSKDTARSLFDYSVVFSFKLDQILVYQRELYKQCHYVFRHAGITRLGRHSPSVVKLKGVRRVCWAHMLMSLCPTIPSPAVSDFVVWILWGFVTPKVRHMHDRSRRFDFILR
jgi:hypothetical protein